MKTCACLQGPRAHTRGTCAPREHSACPASAWTGVGTQERRGGHTDHAHGAGLTFTDGEVVGAGHTGVTSQPGHAGPAAALAAAGVTGCVQGALGGAAAGWAGKAGCGRAGGTHPPPPHRPSRTLTGTLGEAVEGGAALLAGRARVAGAAAAHPPCPAELVQGTPGVAGAGCRRLGVRPWAPGGGPPTPPSPALALCSPWQSG